MRLTLIEQAAIKLAELMRQHAAKDVAPAALQAVASGASGRVIMMHEGMIGVYWTDDRADNNSFLPAAKSLHRAGLHVPHIDAEWTDGQGCGACLMSYLGERDILSYKSAPWPELKCIYQLAFKALPPLYSIVPDWPLQVPFDADYYAWEQDYFVEHLLKSHLGVEQGCIHTLDDALLRLAEFLSALPRVPVHRDCQSQNIMIHSGEAWLIDFQGMRMGRMEYDLASLIYDPYMDLSPVQRQELLECWQLMTGQALDWSIFAACGMQRLMQALGAFANIGTNQARPWYLEQIPAGLRALKQMAMLAPAGSPAQQLALCLNDVKNLLPS